VTTEPPTEAPQLRPLGVGDIVDRVFALYRSRPLLFLAVATVPYLVLFLLITGVAVVFAATFGAFLGPLTQVVSQPTSDVSFAALGAAVGGVLVLVSVIVIAAVVILSAQSAALIAATSALYLRRPVTAGDVFGEGLRAAPRVIGASIIVFLLLIALWAALAIVMVVANQGLATALGILFGFVATAYIFASTLVAPVVATLEHAGPLTAIRRSFRLSAGNRWRIIGVQLLLLILNAVIGALLSAIFLGSFINDLTVRTVVQQVANLITNVAWAPVQWGTFAILYYDLRVRHEAFDLQLAAESLPRPS
jgi:hypothetical protein